jgi:hypothetical protein
MKGFAFLKTCNHYPEPVFNYGGITYHASDEDYAITFRGDLVVNLTQTPGIRASSGAYNIPELKDHMINLPEELVIGWSDFARPPVKATFWAALHSYCKTNKYKNVLFHCQQSHGRTGTALASMLISLQKKSAVNAIKEVRQVHCKYAVESSKQIEYLLLLDNELNNRLPPANEEEFDALITSLEPPRQGKRNTL